MIFVCASQVLEKVRNNKRPEIPDQCPVGLSKLIKKCWDPNPGKRLSFKVNIFIILKEIKRCKIN